jgi:hypothetical protein
MTWTVTIAGKTFSNVNLDGTAYADDSAGLPAILAAIAEEAAYLKGVAATSATALVPSPGSRIFTLQQTPSWSVGALVRAISASAPDHYMIGAISGRDGDDLTIAVTIAAGDGSKSDWVLTYPVIGAFVQQTDLDTALEDLSNTLLAPAADAEELLAMTLALAN